MASISLFSHPLLVFGVYPRSQRSSSTNCRSSRMNCHSKDTTNKEQKYYQEQLQNAKSLTTTTTTNKDLKFHPNNSPEEPKSPPFVTALKTIVDENHANFQFPGHNQGHKAPSSLTQLIGESPFLYDVGEVKDQFTPKCPILEAEKQAAKVFGASNTWFLVGGSTSGNHAAIMATCNPGDTVIVQRNCHISIISALVLCGAIPKYVFPDYDSHWNIATLVTPSKVEQAIKELELEGKKPAAVLITTPTYNGICSDVKEISKICHSRSIPLIVDEAHGAHFGFHPKLPISALKQGADLVVQSTHKVLLSFSQSSMLHMSLNSQVQKENIDRCVQTLQSTSPNFLLLASLDATAAELKENPESVLDNAVHLAIEAKYALNKIQGISVLEHSNIDPLRVTVGVHDLGVSGYEARDLLFNDQRVVPVLTSSQFITFLFTPGSHRDHVTRVITGFKNLSSSCFLQKREKSRPITLRPFVYVDTKLTPREAFFAKKKIVDINDTLGKICGELICPFPPGIPVMFPGEVISEKALDILLQAKACGARITGASDPLLSSIVVCDV